MSGSDYIIRGGLPGRERLRILARVMRPGTVNLFDRLGVGSGMTCLDAGCGGGDVSFELARRVGGSGRVQALDIDEDKLAIARREAREQGLANVEFAQADITRFRSHASYDLVYARFLLSHLREPDAVLRSLSNLLRPGGQLIVEDIDFRGHFCHPDIPAFRRYIELYTQAVQGHGGDPNIGPRLPALLRRAGLENIGLNIVQPAGISGDVKLLSAVTMENIRDAVLDEKLASPEELTRITTALYEAARDTTSLMSIPRVVQCWASAAAEGKE